MVLVYIYIYIYIYIDSLTVAVLMQGPQEACRVLVGSSFEASWGLFWPLLRPVLGLLGGLGPVWGLCGRPWGFVGAFLALPWTVLGASWAVLGPSWAVVGASWGPLGPSWGGLGGVLGRLGVSENRKVVYAGNVRFPTGMGRFWPLGALLGGLLGLSWGVFGTCWTVLGPSWASWGHLGRLGALFWRLGPSRSAPEPAAPSGPEV